MVSNESLFMTEAHKRSAHKRSGLVDGTCKRTPRVLELLGQH